MPIPRIRPSVADSAGNAVRSLLHERGPFIRAYHGSPYDFDRFDASKIGTGEGNQAFGHGLYFAGNEDVARGYRDNLRDAVSRPVPESIQKEMEAAYAEFLEASRRAREGSQTDKWRELKDQFEVAAGKMDAAQHKYREAAHNPGHMYEVEIGHPESSLLDWDRPVHSQPDQIYDALGWSANSPLFDTLGRDGWTGRRAYYKMAEELGGADKVAKSLLDSGIPGIRYLDAGSRRAGQGTRNYVIFPGAEDQIRILRKFAVPGVVGTGAAAMSGGAEE